MQLMNIEEWESPMAFTDDEPHEAICNTSFREYGASEQSGALSFSRHPPCRAFCFLKPITN